MQKRWRLSIYDPTAICWVLAAFSLSWSFTQSVGLFRRGISQSQGRYLYTGQHKCRINAQTSMPRGIRTHDPSVWRAKTVLAFDFLDRAAAVIHCDLRNGWDHISEIYQKVIELKMEVSLLLTSLLTYTTRNIIILLVQHSRKYAMTPKDETKHNSVVIDR
jgi:hypothetical protein